MARQGDTGPDGATWKVCGQECVDDIFYTFVVRSIYGDKSKDPLMRQTSFNASLIKSTDRGRTWTRGAKENYSEPMWPGTRFGAPCFIHYGKNGGQVARDEADEFVYVMSNNGFWNGGDDFILGRVRRADLPRLNASDWKYFRGGDGLQDRAWSGDLAQAQPILSQERLGGLLNFYRRAALMDGMNMFTLLAEPVRGFRGVPAGEWGGETGRRRQLLWVRDPGGVRRHLFGVGEGPAEAVAGAKQESMGLMRKQFVKKFVREQWIVSCKSLGRPLVYHL